MILAAAIVLGLIASIDADVRWLSRRPRSNAMSVEDLARLEEILNGSEKAEAP